MAFEKTHNLIQSWAWPLPGICARNSYCLGVAYELRNIAKAEQQASERAAKENDAKSRAATTTPSLTYFQQASAADVDNEKKSASFADSDGIPGPSEAPVDKFMETDKGGYESEDISDNDSVLADFNDEDLNMPDVTAPFGVEPEKFAKAKSAPSKDQSTSEPRKVEWASSMQLSIYRQNVAKISEDVLKANNLTLHSRKVINRSVKDKQQYAQGIKDSRKIKIRGARIENGRA